jgi:hypothetical protein
MGVFGSDLLCAYQLRPGTHVIELIWDESEDPVVIRTCAILGLHHHFVRCDIAQVAQKRRRKAYRDIVVDCHALRNLLRSLLG